MQKEGFNPITEQTVMTERRVLKAETELLLKEKYAAFVGRIINSAAVEV